MKILVQDGVLKLPWIEFILAQTGLWCYTVSPEFEEGYVAPLASVRCFLATFAGHWPSRSERSIFSNMADYSSPMGGFYPHFLQVHFRLFKQVESLNKKLGTDGLECLRQSGHIGSAALHVESLFIEERRISILGTMPVSRYEGVNAAPAYYRILILTEDGVDPPWGGSAPTASKGVWAWMASLPSKRLCS